MIVIIFFELLFAHVFKKGNGLQHDLPGSGIKVFICFGSWV